jgi:putative hydrolase of the HAD superfamily
VNFTGIKAITFDGGGTLLEPWPSVGEVYAKVAAGFGFGELSATELNREFAKAWKKKQNFDYSPDAWQTLVQECFSTVGSLSTELFKAIYERFAEPDVWRVYDDVRPTLSELHQRGYRLGVISNWDLRLESLLNRLNLSQYFDAIVLSIKVGATKPSQRIFECAVAALNSGPGEVLHIGDSLEEDVVGAERAGLRALLLDRGREVASQRTISSLAAMPTLLK